MKKKFKTINIGSSPKPYKVVYDMGNIPQGLSKGMKFITAKDLTFADKTFSKGTEITFVDYVIQDSPSSSDEYDFFLYRVALFNFNGDSLNRILNDKDVLRISLPANIVGVEVTE